MSSSANSASAPKAVATNKIAPTSSVDSAEAKAAPLAAPSSSYAKMLNPKAAAAKQSDKETTMTTDKETKSTKPKPATDEKPVVAKPIAVVKEIKAQNEPATASAAAASTSSAVNAKSVDETGVEAEEDDPTFIPVVPHHIRKENKRRERPVAGPAKPRGAPNANAPAKNNEKPSRRAERPERKERRGADKEVKIEKSDGVVKTEVASTEQVSPKSVTEDEKEKDESKKFVEAPIPVVNAWKVDSEVS